MDGFLIYLETCFYTQQTVDIKTWAFSIVFNDFSIPGTDRTYLTKLLLVDAG